MYVEAFHRVLKYLYLKGKVNKRMDKCIHVLLKFTRDKGFERLIKLEKRKVSKRNKIIQLRHRKSLELPLDSVYQIEETSQWTVNSEFETNCHYSVTLENLQCPFKCHIQCDDCRICVHMYTCNCMDALIQSTICKHIHLVVRFRTNQTNQTNQTDFSQTDVQKHSDPSKIMEFHQKLAETRKHNSAIMITKERIQKSYKPYQDWLSTEIKLHWKV